MTLKYAKENINVKYAEGNVFETCKRKHQFEVCKGRWDAGVVGLNPSLSLRTFLLTVPGQHGIL